MRSRKARYTGLLAGLGLLVAAAWQPAHADLSAFVGYVGFGDVKDAKIAGSPGFGLRWGKSGGLIGGETALMIARPEREITLQGSGVGRAMALVSDPRLATGVADTTGSKGTGTALFYEARLIVNIPLGKIKPFADVGFGQIITTKTEAARDPIAIPTSIGGVPISDQERQRIEAANKTLKALNAVSKLQRNMAFSYGVGARYGVTSRLDLRVDLRQYAVLSVKGLLVAKATEMASEQVQQAADALGVGSEKKQTTLYSEMSLGVNFKF